MGGKNSPDYGDLAVQQGEANAGVVRDQTYANRPTQYTPWGYTAWQANPYTDPGSGETTTQWTQTQGLTPELQELLNKQIAIQGERTDIAGGLTNRMRDEFGAPMSFDNLSPLAEVPNAQFTLPENYEGLHQIGDPTALRQRAEDAVFNKMASRLTPQFDSARQNLEIKLRNQGLSPLDEAYQSQMGALDMQQNDAFGQASYDAIRAGLGEQAQLFNQDLGMRQQGVDERNNQFAQALGSNAQNYNQMRDSANYANQLRQQQMTEQMQQRGYSLNEIQALLHGQQVGMPQMPNFATAGVAQAAPIYQAGVDQGNFDQASDPTAGLLELGGTLGAAYMMSDRRLKTNVKRIATVNGYPWYSFDYVWGESAQGVMADEVPAEFTARTPSGYLAVNYGALLA